MLPKPAKPSGSVKRPRIAVIGGGFSGAVFALQLARKADQDVDIQIIEPRATLGAGLAYSTHDPSHRINVPASKMTVFAEDPQHFDRWLRRLPELDEKARYGEHLYPSRSTFGRYIASMVEEAARLPHDTTIHHVRDVVVQIRKRGELYELELASGEKLTADLLVLAVSHPPPTVPAILTAALQDDPALIADPWRDNALAGIDPKARIIIVGTGLTMVDAVATLDRLGHQGQITAFSRRGLLPRGHAEFSTPLDDFKTHPPIRSARLLSHHVRRAVKSAEAQGLPWQAVFDDVRANAPTLWGNLPETERKRLLRHLRSWWDVHRYRMAPQMEAILDRKRADGTFEIFPASLRSVARHDNHIEIELHRRFTPDEDRLLRPVDHVIVTTGPAHGDVIRSSPVLTSLAQQDLVQGDNLGLGLDVDETSHARATNGISCPTLLVVGPLARATFGELMGLPQVSWHADFVAGQTAIWLGSRDQSMPSYKVVSSCVSTDSCAGTDTRLVEA